MDAHARLRVEESELTRAHAHGEEARHRCAPLGQILQTILAFAPIFFPREKDGEDTRAKGREKMNLRNSLGAPTLLEHLSSVTFAARIIITSVESIRFVFLLLLRG